MNKVVSVILISVLFIMTCFLLQSALAGTQHGVNGMVNNASDGTPADGAAVLFVIVNPTTSNNYCNLTDEVGEGGLSGEPQWYAQDIGNCAQQWQENDTVYIFIVKDALHTAKTSVMLTKKGNDQAPTVNLSSPQFCGDGNCSGNETCLNCPVDCATVCNNNSVCEPCPTFCKPHPLNLTGCCENATNCIDCRCNMNGICEPLLGENCTVCPNDCHCPDGKCQPEWNETNITCALDCRCGNGICENITGLCFSFNETSVNCPQDCFGCFCGDGICQVECGENAVTCCADCCAQCDYDNICDMGETYANCPDCALFCGNLICEADKNETAESCPIDCATCGNGVCEADKGEDWKTCPMDCYAARCGDERCELAESQENCCKDCKCARKGFNLLGVFFGKVSFCSKNRCVPHCCLFGLCWGIFIGSFGICWYYLVILALIIGIYIYLRKKKKKAAKAAKAVKKIIKK